MSPAWRGLFATVERRCCRRRSGRRSGDERWRRAATPRALAGRHPRRLVHVAATVRRWPWQEVQRADWDEDAERSPWCRSVTSAAPSTR